jgi:hypothetical protein
VAALRRALLAAVTEDDLQAITRALIEKARGGDVAAAKLLLQYTLGKPAEATDPDTLDLQEWQHYQQAPAFPAVTSAILGAIPPEMACTLVRAVLPVLADLQMQQIRDGLKAPPQVEPAPPATEPAAPRSRRPKNPPPATDSDPTQRPERTHNGDSSPADRRPGSDGPSAPTASPVPPLADPVLDFLTHLRSGTTGAPRSLLPEAGAQVRRAEPDRGRPPGQTAPGDTRAESNGTNGDGGAGPDGTVRPH